MPKQVVARAACSAAADRSRCPTSTAPTTCCMLGANPFASNGSLVHRARLARAGSRRSRPAAGGSSSSTRGAAAPRRSADEHVFIRPGTDALLLVAHGAHALRRGPRRPRPRSTRTSRASTRSRVLAKRLHPRGRRAGVRRRRRRRSAGSPASSPPRRPPRVYGRIGTCTAGVRHARAAGSSTCSTCSPATSTGPGGAMFPTPGDRARQQPRHAGHGTRLPRRAAARSRVRGLPEVDRRAAGRRAGRGDRDAGRGPDPGARHRRRQPGACRRPNGGRLDAALASLDFMVSRRHLLNETTRHADVILPPPDAARASALRPRAATARRAQRGRTTRRRSSTRARRARRVGDPAPAGAASSPGRAPTPTRRSLDDLADRRCCGSAVGDEPDSPVDGRDRRGAARRARRRRRRARAAARRHAAHRSVRRRVRRRTRTGCRLDVLEANPHGVDLGPLQPRLPDVLRTPSGRSSSRPSRSSPTWPGCAAVARPRPPTTEPGARRPAAPALEQLVDAQRRRAGEGQAAVHAAGPPRRRRPRSGSSTAAGRGRGRRVGAVAVAGRGDRRGSCPAS